MHGVETILNVLGSVCLLLWGVRMVRTGLTRAFGAALRRAISACSRNRFTAFLGGIAVTGLLQSSTATSLLVSSFAGRGLIALSIAIAVMLGADIGTTIAAQILSFDLGWASPLLIGVASTQSDPTVATIPTTPVISLIQELVLHRKALSANEIENHVDINRPN